MNFRLLGAVQLATAAIIAYFCIAMPIQAAQHHEATISFFWKGAILCPVTFVMGVVFLVLGDEAQKLRDDGGKLTRPGQFTLALAGAAFILGMVLAYFMQSFFSQLGYHESFL